MSTLSAVEATAGESRIFTVDPPVTLTSEGQDLVFGWRPVAGATGARVGSASVTVDPATGGDGRDLGVAVGARSGVDEIRIKPPEAGNRIRSCTLPDLVTTRPDGSEATLRSAADVAALGRRLVVAPVVRGAVQAPVVTVPALARQGAVPPQLTGGFFSGSVLTLPDPVGDELVITLCEHDSPADFTRMLFSHGDVSVGAAPAPTGLHVEGPEGDEVFALGGPLGDTVRADVRAALERHLGTAVTGAAEQAVVHVRADIQGNVHLRFDVAGAVIERRVTDRVLVHAEGNPVWLVPPLPPAGRAPARTVADVTVTHLGLALHAASDPLPTPGQPLTGAVVRDRPVERVLPDGVLTGQRLRRVAVIGRPLTSADLRLDVNGHVATAEAVSAGEPGSAQPVWFDLGEDVAVADRLRIALTATQGAFGWAGAEPAVRFATVVDPPGTTVRLADLTVTVTGVETLVPGAQIAGPEPWLVSTDQFCEVALANVTQEFAP